MLTKAEGTVVTDNGHFPGSQSQHRQTCCSINTAPDLGQSSPIMTARLRQPPMRPVGSCWNNKVAKPQSAHAHEDHMSTHLDMGSTHTLQLAVRVHVAEKFAGKTP